MYISRVIKQGCDSRGIVVGLRFLRSGWCSYPKVSDSRHVKPVNKKRMNLISTRV